MIKLKSTLKMLPVIYKALVLIKMWSVTEVCVCAFISSQEIVTQSAW